MASLFARRVMNCSHSPPCHGSFPLSKRERTVSYFQSSLHILTFCACSCSRNLVFILRLVLLIVLTYVTLTSKNTLCLCCQKPLALISKRASSLVFAVRKLNISLSCGIRGGSDCTFVHILFYSVVSKSYIIMTFSPKTTIFT